MHGAMITVKKFINWFSYLHTYCHQQKLSVLRNGRY